MSFDSVSELSGNKTDTIYDMFKPDKEYSFMNDDIISSISHVSDDNSIFDEELLKISKKKKSNFFNSFRNVFKKIKENLKI